MREFLHHRGGCAVRAALRPPGQGRVLRRAASSSRVGGVNRSGDRMGVQRAGRRCGDASERRMDRCRDRPDGRRGVGDRRAAQGLSTNRGRGTVRSSGSLTGGASGGTLLMLSNKRGGSTSLFSSPRIFQRRRNGGQPLLTGGCPHLSRWYNIFRDGRPPSRIRQGSSPRPSTKKKGRARRVRLSPSLMLLRVEENPPTTASSFGAHPDTRHGCRPL